MIEVNRIYPECYADTFLVQLIFDKRIPGHLFGITEVAKGLQGFTEDNFIIGVIDTDKFKREPSYIKEFTEEVDNKIADEGLIVMKIPNTNRHIIRLHPAFEKWILEVARVSGIKPEEYGYNDFKQFRRAAKNMEIEKDENFANFLLKIINANPPAIQTLRFWLMQVND